jgi:hypothetical protein
VFVRPDNVDPPNEHLRMGGPTPQDIADQVWGPYRFTPGVNGAVRTGQRVPAFPLIKGASYQLAMERTSQPGWDHSTPDMWLNQYKDHSVRLTLVCAGWIRAVDCPV